MIYDKFSTQQYFFPIRDSFFTFFSYICTRNQNTQRGHEETVFRINAGCRRTTRLR